MSITAARSDHLMPEPEQCWAAVCDRDPQADGRFFYGVITTGVFCRPVCPSRRPNRENVRFYSSAEAAADAGFRPCQRCYPDQPAPQAQRQQQMVAACREIENAESEPSLSQLAAACGLSRFHFQREFKHRIGLTPRAYFQAHRANRLKAALASGETSTRAGLEAGFGSSGRLYAATGDHLGMTPGDYRAGGRGETIRFALGDCRLGVILVAATARGICAIELGDTADALLQAFQSRFPQAELVGGDPAFARWVAVLVGYVNQPNESVLDLPLDIQGTAFQQKVWQVLRAIPCGDTVTYTDVANALGQPTAARAVARACATNSIALAIPCHRVVRSDGSLSGYRWGIERKAALLERESDQASR
ncbi:MAG: bifunctional DNA-binding transcriptional regulator/O6-methylguanine-DNA methyltransferase Ada [Alteromonadaceae bacterium]|nr:bifunctional DNA-binding transcriptional regulator/O6-methylguanine-DNA methyltransferase Ada [Alteromonadaceae bacterium]MBH85041.1 bifunctional DNA-binding transcriptional regulator/O6-methylguanine-DNA methyltransferase Ada [Alteromonadaceae bacterium]